MIDLQNKNICPTIEEIAEYVRNLVLTLFCSDIKDAYRCNEKIEYSSCSWEKGWNIKLKKAGKTLCTIYCQSVRLNCKAYMSKRKKETGKDG